MAIPIDLQPSRATVFDENDFEVVLLFSLSGLTLSLLLFRFFGEVFVSSFFE
jgi:hypothetical protein